MKYISGLIILLVVFGCGDQEKISQLEEKNAQLEAEYNLMLKETEVKDEYIEEYTKTINEVYDNLERIRKREGFITKVSKDLEKQENTPIREKMMSNLASIDSYLEKSKKQLQALQKKHSGSDQKIASLEETVQKLNQIIEEKEQSLVELREQVNQLNLQIAEVEQELETQSELVEVQRQKLNTGYYIIANEKELKQKGIIIEEGGFLGFNKAKKLANSFNNDDFTKTDIFLTDIISIGQELKKVRLISPHNPDSFHLVEDESQETYLEIIDPEEFWKINYLVILTKG